MTGNPVKLVLTREEEFSATLSRHEYILRLKVGIKKDGTLTAIEAHVISNEGAYVYKTGPLGVAAMAMTVTYKCPNTRFEGHRVYTNMMCAGAMRGYGGPQAHFAMESMMDMIAEKVGIDPVEFRVKNYRQEGDKGFANLSITVSGLAECLAKGKEQIGWERRGKPGNSVNAKKRGIGMACFTHPTGTTGFLQDYSAASVRINEDGTAHLFVGAADLGTGSNTTLAQIAAEELGLDLDGVDVVSGDTSTVSFDRGALASKTLYTAGNAVRAAVADVKQKILLRAAEKLEVDAGVLEFQDRRIYIKKTPEKGISYSELVREASKAIGGNVTFLGEASFENTSFPQSFGAQFAEVEVNTETGHVEVLKIVAIQDNGKAINPTVVEGQIEGALQQFIGYALTEAPIVDKKTGEMLNPDFANYVVLTALDMPKVEVGLVETYEPTGPFGAKGMSELPTLGIAPAIANAIYNAIGVRFTEIPITLEKVVKALDGG